MDISLQMFPPLWLFHSIWTLWFSPPLIPPVELFFLGCVQAPLQLSMCESSGGFPHTIFVPLFSGSASRSYFLQQILGCQWCCGWHVVPTSLTLSLVQFAEYWQTRMHALTFCGWEWWNVFYDLRDFGLFWNINCTTLQSSVSLSFPWSFLLFSLCVLWGLISLSYARLDVVFKLYKIYIWY